MLDHTTSRTDQMRMALESEFSRLTRLRDRISAELDQAHGDPSVTIVDFDQHPGDAGSDALEQAVDVSVLGQISSRIADVEAALHRLRNGHYGRCEMCGGEIPVERLEARPDARLCKTHQEEAERSGRFERLRAVGFQY
jgi:DnaK suppressor protein